MRTMLALTALFAALPALAQAPAQTPGPRAPAARAPAPATAQPPAPPPVFPCRTAAEICFLGIVAENQVLVIFTNAPNGQGIEAKPIDVVGPDGARLDLAPHGGRVAMLTGEYDAKVGLTKAAIVEVAGPLASLIVKAQLAGGGPEEPQGRAGAATRPRR